MFACGKNVFCITCRNHFCIPFKALFPHRPAPAGSRWRGPAPTARPDGRTARPTGRRHGLAANGDGLRPTPPRPAADALAGGRQRPAGDHAPQSRSRTKRRGDGKSCTAIKSHGCGWTGEVLACARSCCPCRCPGFCSCAGLLTGSCSGPGCCASASALASALSVIGSRPGVPGTAQRGWGKGGTWAAHTAFGLWA